MEPFSAVVSPWLRLFEAVGSLWRCFVLVDFLDPF